MMRALRVVAARCLALGAGFLRAQWEFEAQELANPPTAGRLSAIRAAAASSSLGWSEEVEPLRQAALQSYALGRLSAADGWFHVYQWAALLGETEGSFNGGWVKAVVDHHVNYTGMEGSFPNDERPLGVHVSAPVQAWFLSHPAFSEEFFSNLKDVDYLPKVLATLDGLYRRSPERFERYSSLALAIALVYDVPAPAYWPHVQVTPECLSRTLPNPAVPYDWFTREDALGRTYFRLSQLRAEELKFVVDGAASATDLSWAVANVREPLDSFAKVYDRIRYREDRAASLPLCVWRSGAYSLEAIQQQGGICIDQAYFASQVGKAHGIPTLLFRGQGQDGRHAWFGYLEGGRHWRLDAGRYAEQRLVTGYALDPQTWEEISDHELQFLAERFRALPTFLQSRVHQEFAQDLLDHGDALGAQKAARLSVGYESRNLISWEVLISAAHRLGVSPAQQEALMREAMLAFTKYPDLVLGYGNRIVASLRARGERSLAEFEERNLAERMRGDRMDLAVVQAASILTRSIGTDPLERQVATYESLLAEYGRGSGAAFYDGIVVGFAEYLDRRHERARARQAVERARDALGVQPGTQLALEIDAFLAKLQG